jgi:hypothetical protein
MVKPAMSSESPPERFEVVARLFFGAVIGAFVGLMVCLRVRTVSTRELWPWLVLPASGLLVGLLSLGAASSCVVVCRDGFGGSPEMHSPNVERAATPTI